MNLKEKLDEALPTTDCSVGSGLPCGVCSNCRARRIIESFIYGEEKECGACGGSGREPGTYYTCLSCHGTGKTREPDLVERLAERVVNNIWSLPPDISLVEVICSYLRQELGEMT